MSKLITFLCFVALSFSDSYAQRGPGTGRPGTGKPGNGKPGTGRPGNGKPGNGKPGNGGPGNGGPGNGKPGNGGGVGNIPGAPGNGWIKRYTGNPSFRLTDNPKYAQFKQIATEKRKQLEGNNAKIDGAKKKVDTLKAESDKTTKEIASVTNSIVTKQSELKTNRQTVKTLTEANETAKLALIGAKQVEAEAIDKVQKATTKHKSLKDACDAAPTPECQAKVKEAYNKLQPLIAKSKDASDTVKKLQTKISNNEKKIADAKAAIPKLDAEIKTLATKKTQLEAKNATTKKSLAEAQKVLKTLQDNKTRLTGEYKKVMIAWNDFHDILVQDVLAANKLGLRTARSNGIADGTDLANERGSSFGHSDGSSAGLIDGERQGREREYQSGVGQGQVDGTQKGTVDGIDQGSIDGEVEGNKIAAKREADAEASSDASRSDAAKVGEKQGIAAGFKRAVSTGNSRGTQIGQDQAIEKNESQSLKDIKVSGPYAGSFNYQVPEYPRRYVGPRYQPRRSYRRPILRESYSDGYNYEYSAATKEAYYSIIEAVYERAYTNSYQRALSEALSKYYQADYDKGYSDAYQPAYDQAYASAYEENFNEKKSHYAANPNRSSATYKNTYASHYQSKYAQYYEAIRKASFNEHEQAEFNKHIAEQTEKYRKISYASTQKIYDTTPVLKFVSISYTDAGDKGVAANDGVFQPNEKVNAEVQILNFGKVSAKNVKLTLSNGSTSNISVDGLSSVQVTGAAQGAINEGQPSKSNFSMVGAVTVSGISGIAARHFEGSGTLKSINDSLYVQYPMSLKGLSFSSQPVAGKTNKLSVSLKSVGNRSYQGPIEVDLGINGLPKSDLVNFQSLSVVNSSQMVSGASLSIDPSEVFEGFSLFATVSKNGVILGVLEQSLSEVAHAEYSSKPGLPILVTSAKSDASEALDIVSELGGLSKVSLFDVSLSSNNPKMSLKGANLITTGSYASALEAMIAGSEKVSVVMVSDKESIKSLKKAPSMSDAYGLMYSFESKSTPLLLAEKSEVIAQKVALVDLKTALKDTVIYKMNSTELSSKLSSMGSSVSPQSKELQMINIMAFHQVKKLNTAFVKLSAKKQRKYGKKQLPKEDFFLQKLKGNGATQKVLLAYGMDSLKVMEELTEKSGTAGLIDKKLARHITKAVKDTSKDLEKELKDVDRDVFDFIKDTSPVFLPKLEVL